MRRTLRVHFLITYIAIFLIAIAISNISKAATIDVHFSDTDFYFRFPVTSPLYLFDGTNGTVSGMPAPQLTFDRDVLFYDGLQPSTWAVQFGFEAQWTECKLMRHYENGDGEFFCLFEPSDED